MGVLPYEMSGAIVCWARLGDNSIIRLNFFLTLGLSASIRVVIHENTSFALSVPRKSNKM